jgi:excisionase family DNA binding protein
MIPEQQNPTRCEPLITADRAAELLKLHPKTVKRLAQAGTLPGMKIGRVWRFRESSLDAWMSAQLQCSGHPSPKGERLQ